MPRVETEELLKDARLVIDYAVRIGSLPDEKLIEAVNSLELSSTDGITQDLGPLLAALNNGIRAIAPMTLLELRAGRNPFDAKNQRLTRNLQMFMCALTIGLTAVVASFTEYLHREETAIKALRQVQDMNPLDKLNALRRMVRFDKVLDQDSAIHHDRYHRAVRELREVQSNLSATYDLVSNVAENAPWAFARRLFLKGAEYSTTSAAIAAAPVANPMVEYSDDCDQKRQNDASGGSTYAPWLSSVMVDLLEEYCCAKKTNLLLSLPNTAGPVFRIQTSMAALSGWVLPFLYGLLGALVFVMRDLLNPRTPTAGLFPVLLRVSLGGIAGIIIGWFCIPSASKTADLVSITSIPFGLAFLTGFSIDVLFSLLDRLNRTVSDSSGPQLRTQSSSGVH
jgi:hypothetical protein